MEINNSDKEEDKKEVINEHINGLHAQKIVK